MLSRFCNAVVVGCLLVAPATAQTVRFDTNVGTFDLELNPTGNPNLQGHVNNLLAYVEAGRYDLSSINRAPENFVLQMGGFITSSLIVPSTEAGYVSIDRFDSVIVDSDGDRQVDFDTAGLTNTRGTVTLALGSDQNGPLVNSGTSSFFVSLADNSRLDVGQPQGGFIPFATISDMATIDLIMTLNNVNLFGRNPAADPTFTDVPLLDGGRQVLVERAFVLEDLVAASVSSGVEDPAESLAASSGGVSSSAPAALQALSVPEPPALVLALGGLVLIYLMKPGKHRSA